MTGAIYHDLTGFGHINSSAFEVGVAFHVSEAITIDGLQWYRYQTGSSVAPEIVRLWRVSDTSELGRLSPVPDDGAVGWQHGALATPIDIVPGEVYVVAGYFPGSAGQPSTADPGTLTPSLTITLETSHRRYRSGSSGYPASADAGSFIAMDVTGAATTTGGTGGGGTDTNPDWLSTDPDVNLHQEDGLPWRTDANVTILRGEAEGSSGFAAIKAVADTIATSVGTGLRTAVTTLTTNLATANAALVHAATTWSDALAATLQAMSDDFASFFATTGGLAGGPTGALSGRSAFPDTGWNLADETDWDTDLAWPVAADLYVVTVTTPPPGVAADSFAGVTWYHRLGSWTVLNGDQAGARAFLEFSPQQLQDGGRRMPGLALRTKPGTLGHVQAWVLA